MKFKDVAWASLVYRYMNKGRDGETLYNSIISDQKYLKRLVEQPQLQDFERIRNFIVHFGVRFMPKTNNEGYLKVWPQLKRHVTLLKDQNLLTCDLSDAAIQNAITEAFSLLQYPYNWGGDTVASKVIHFFNIRFFMMWDEDIQNSYFNSGVVGYLDYLKDMQEKAAQMVQDFSKLGLSGQIEEFLSTKLGYSIIRPLTKYLDEYNWITITRGWPPSLPEWLRRLYA